MRKAGETVNTERSVINTVHVVSLNGSDMLPRGGPHVDSGYDCTVCGCGGIDEFQEVWI